MLSFETRALVPPLIIKRIPDHIRPALSFGVLLESLFQNRPLIHHVALVLHVSYIIIYDTVYVLLLSAVLFLLLFYSQSWMCLWKTRIISLLCGKLELIHGFP